MTAISPAMQIDQAFFYIMGISVAILLMITVTMIYFVIHYRRDRHPVAADIRGNWLLEVIWTIIPTIIALSMFYLGWNSYLRLRNVPDDALIIKTVGEMYEWIFTYPEGKESEGELVVPLGRAIKLDITSNDVLHSLFIPAFRIKIDAVSGMHTYSWFYADKLGEFSIQCSEFCGIGHSDMTATLKIVTDKEYNDWLLSKTDEDSDDW